MNKGFDLIAPVYDSLADFVFGDAIRKAQLFTVSFIPEGAAVLIIGGGTGWYLQELLEKQQLKKVVYLETSQTMIRLTRQKIAPYLNVNPTIVDFRLGTEASIQAHEQYDVVILHFLLDLFSQPRVLQIMHVCKSVLKERGICLFSDFVLAKTDSGYWWKKMLLYNMYTFFRFCCQVEARELPDFEQAFSENDMTCISAAGFFNGLITSRVYTKAKRKSVNSL